MLQLYFILSNAIKKDYKFNSLKKKNAKVIKT